MNDVNVTEGYKSTDIGVIPEDWEVYKLGDIAFISSGVTPSRSNSSYWNGDIPWITTTQINFNTIFASEEFITKLGLNNSSAKLYDKNTLLMAMYGQGKTRGKVAILGIKAAINQACASIQINRNNLNKYIFFSLSHQYEEIRKLSNTGNQENLNGNLIKTISLPLPPLPEQKAIARVLSDVDELIREWDSLIAKKRDIKQGTMQQLLTGKKRLPGFSGEWEVKKLGEITISIASGKSKSKSETGNYPLYGSTGIIGYRKIYNYEGQKILIARVGANAGKINIVEGQYCVSDNTLIISFSPNISCIKFNYYQLERYNLNNLVFGSGQPLITGSQLKNLSITLPTLPEQKAIAQILSDMDAEIEALEKKRDKYKAIKQGMMQELLTGKTRLINH